VGASVLHVARLTLIALLLVFADGPAAFDLRFETEALRGPGWELTGLELVVERSDDSSKHLLIRADALSLSAFATRSLWPPFIQRMFSLIR
jgi:hypothetical protein